MLIAEIGYIFKENIKVLLAFQGTEYTTATIQNTFRPQPLAFMNTWDQCEHGTPPGNRFIVGAD